jgi:hypothetical protein
LQVKLFLGGNQAIDGFREKIWNFLLVDEFLDDRVDVFDLAFLLFLFIVDTHVFIVLMHLELSVMDLVLKALSHEGILHGHKLKGVHDKVLATAGLLCRFLRSCFLLDLFGNFYHHFIVFGFGLCLQVFLQERI